MKLRMLRAPWWARWSLATGLIAVLIGGFYLAIAPHTVAALGPVWSVVALVGFSVAFSAAILALAEPQRQASLAALSGLDRSQQRQAVAAVRHGPVPEDPDVIAGALRLAAMVEPERRRTRWLWIWLWAGAAVCLVVGLGTLSGLLAFTARTGWVNLTVGSFVVAATAWGRYQRRRFEHRIAQLRAVAPADMSVDSGADSAPEPPSIWWLLTLIAATAGALTPLVVWPAPVLSAPCRAAHEVVTLIYEQRGLLSAPHDHSVAEFRRWSARLQEYADEVDDADIGPRLQRIADLAEEVVAQREENEGLDEATLRALLAEDQHLDSTLR